MVVVIGGGCGSQEMGLGLKIGKYENKNRRFELIVFGFWDKDRVSFFRSHIFVFLEAEFGIVAGVLRK